MMLIIIAMLVLTTACSSGSSGNSNESGNQNAGSGNQQQQQANNNQQNQELTGAAEEEADDEPAELVFYSTSRDSEEVFNERFGDAIRAKFPNYTIKYIQRVPDSTDLNLLITSGEQIDIIFDSLGSFPGSVIKHGMAYDMTELMNKYGVDLERFEPTLIEAMKQISGGKIYGLPVENNVTVIFYNKDIFDMFGVEYPRDGMTWTEFTELAKQLNVESGGTVYAGYAPSVNHLVIQNSWSMSLIDPETNQSTYGDERWKTIIETEFLSYANNSNYVKAMETYRKGGMLNSNQFLKDRILAMFPGGPLWPFVLKADLDQINWDMVAMPTYEELPGVGYQSYPTYFAITNTAKNKDAAMKVIAYLVSEEFQMEMSKKGNMTTLNNPDIMAAMGTESEYKDKNFGAYFYNKFAPIRQLNPLEVEYSPLYALTNRIPGIVNGQFDLNTALREAQEEANQGIQEVSK
jgi:multiple sugar transport system substrate-binding protein